jgi:hypothetical protein
MIDIPNDLIAAIGLLNGHCSKSEVIWQIIKYPEDNSYYALLTPMHGEYGAVNIKAQFIDDLIMRCIEALPITY